MAETLRVSALDPAADFPEIGPAIGVAGDGATIAVDPGIYPEALKIEKDVTLVASGPPGSAVIEVATGSALHLSAPAARLEGLLFRRIGSGGSYAARIVAGASRLEGCVFQSLSRACLAIEGQGTAPVLTDCQFQNGAKGGLVVFRGARPVLETCTFTENALFGAEVKGPGTQPTFRGCRFVGETVPGSALPQKRA